jgi:hypothetical protein
MLLSRARADVDRAPIAAPAGVPPLSGWERTGAVLTILFGAAVGALGFYGSFGGVSEAAASWGFMKPWILPAAIDSAIPVFTAANLLLIRMDMQLAWVRFVPWALSLVSCALNVAVGHSLWSKVAHGALSLLWVAVSEVAAHVYAARIGAVTGRRMEKIRLSRWLLAPVSTLLLWRRMTLWEVTSYSQALELEKKRLLARAELREKYGWRWRSKTPYRDRVLLRMGSLAPAPTPLAEPQAPVEHVDTAPTERPGMVVSAATATPRPVVTAAVPAQTPQTPEHEQEAAKALADWQPAPLEIPEWSTEDELYEIIKHVIDHGYREAFEPGGPLTGVEIAKVMGQTDGNGRKVRQRLIKTLAAERGVALPQKATIGEVFAAFGHPVTAASS